MVNRGRASLPFVNTLGLLASSKFSTTVRYSSVADLTLICRINLSDLSMSVDVPRSVPDLLTGPCASLRAFKQALHVLAKILRQELRKIDYRLEVRIVTYTDDADAECFPLQELAAGGANHKLSLEDQFREVQALIEEAQAIQKVNSIQGASRSRIFVELRMSLVL